MIVRNEDVDWDRFLELTHEFGTYAACYYPLAFLHSIEPSRVPEAALSKLRPVEGRRGRDYGWQLGKLFDFIEPLPFRPEAQESFPVMPLLKAPRASRGLRAQNIRSVEGSIAITPAGSI